MLRNLLQLNTMSILLWALSAVGLALLGGGIVWVVIVRMRRAALDRRHAEAWDAFAERCPAPPPGLDGESYALTPPPGPAGEVAVRPDGLCLRLEGKARTLWVPWTDLRRLESAGTAGVHVALAGGLHFQVTALGGRAIYEAETASLRPKPRPRVGMGDAG